MNFLFYYELDSFELNSIFNSAIRHKIDLMSISVGLMIKLSSMEIGLNLKSDTNCVFIKSKDTHRYCIISQNQIMSAILPFRFDFDGSLNFNHDRDFLDLNDLYVLSMCIDKIKYEIDNAVDLLSDDIRSLIDEVLIHELHFEKVKEFKYKKLLNHMFFQEDGYLRFDYDEENSDGHIHPLNHLDINFSNNSTFKLGLRERIDFHTFWDILRSDSNCFYLHSIK